MAKSTDEYFHNKFSFILRQGQQGKQAIIKKNAWYKNGFTKLCSLKVINGKSSKIKVS